MLFDLNELSLWVVAAIFAASATSIWLAGTRLSGYVDAISTKTGIGKAFAGMLLLGGITSLPEVAAVSTSAAAGNAPLAVNNLLGTASINLMLLATADIIYGREALTSVAAKPATLMQGVLSMLLAAAVAMVATIGDVPIFGVGIGSAMLALSCGAALWISSDFEHRHVWMVAAKDHGNGTEPPSSGVTRRRRRRIKDDLEGWPFRRLIIATGFVAAVILIGGFLLAISADAIASRTGLASGMIGFVLVGLSTSLPEISTVVAAVRLRHYDMAVGDIFGTNLFNIALIFLADAIYQGDPVLSVAGRFEMIGAILAVLLTGVFIIGLLERHNRTVLRMGFDSLAALALFAVGLIALARTAS